MEPTITQKPTVGRDVHYHHVDGDTVTTLTAKVVKVFSDNCVNLQVFSDGYVKLDAAGSNLSLRTSVSLATEYGQPSCWSWPPRV